MERLKLAAAIAALAAASALAAPGENPLPQRVINYESYVNGLIAERSGDHKAAIAAMQSIIAADKGAVAVYRDLSLLYWQAGLQKEALDTAEEYGRLAEGDPQAMLFLGSFYSMAGKQDKARQCWENVIAKDPDNESALLYLAASYNETDPGKAVGYWEKFVKQEPESSDAWYQMGIAYEKTGSLDKAVGAYGQSVAANPDNQAARLSLAQGLENTGMTDQSVEQFEKYLTLDPRNTAVLLHLAGIYYKKKDIDQAQELFERARASAPRDTSAMFWLGVIAEEKKDFRSAIKYFEEITREQEDPLVLTRLGYYYSSAKEYGKAVKTLKRVVELNPDNPYSNYLLGLAYLDSGDRKKGLRCLEKVLELKPDFYEVHFHIGVVYDVSGQFEKAEQELEKAIAIKPDFATALNYLGYSYADRGVKLDKAEEYIRRAMREEPENPAYMDSLGWTLYKKGKYEEAVKYLEEAYSKSTDALICEHLGDARAKLGQNAEAWLAYARGLDISRGSKALKAKLAGMEKFLLPDTLRRKVLKRAEGNLIQVKDLTVNFSASGEFVSNNTRAYGRLYYLRPDKWKAEILGSFFAPKAVLIQNNGLKVYPEAMDATVVPLAKDVFGYLTGFFNGSIPLSFDTDATVVSVKGDNYTYSLGGRRLTVSKRDGSLKEYADEKVLIVFGKSAWSEGLILPAEINIYSLAEKAALKIKFSGYVLNAKLKESVFAMQEDKAEDEGKGAGKN